LIEKVSHVDKGDSEENAQFLGFTNIFFYVMFYSKSLETALETVSRWKWSEKRVLKELTLNIQKGDEFPVFICLAGGNGGSISARIFNETLCGL
jgi:hypothetical protein